MKNSNKYLSNFLLILLGFFIGFKTFELIQPDNDEFEKKLPSLIKLAEQNYYKELNADELTENAIEGIFSKLDPHSVYLNPALEEAEEENINGNYVGIGVEFEIREDTAVVISPLPDGPSERAGILPGDRIVMVEDSSIVGKPAMNIFKDLRGEENTTAKVTVYRPADKKLIDFRLSREKITIKAVPAYFILSDSIGYIKLAKFSSTSFDEVQSALDNLKQQGMKSLVLDLRNNPGGLLEQAVDIADLFIPGGELIVSIKGRRPEFSEEFKAINESKYEKMPLIILQNGGSASASEILAAAIQDLKRGKIYGERSFGKGLVQRSFKFNDGSAVRLTIAEYFTPSGKNIQRDFSDREHYFDMDYESANDSVNGGVIPDVISDSTSLTSAILKLLYMNMFYSFVRNSFEKGILSQKLKSRYSVSSFTNEYRVRESLITKFKKFIQDQGLYDGIDVNEPKMIDFLKAYIANELWGELGWYSARAKNDPLISAAVTDLRD